MQRQVVHDILGAVGRHAAKLQVVLAVLAAELQLDLLLRWFADAGRETGFPRRFWAAGQGVAERSEARGTLITRGASSSSSTRWSHRLLSLRFMCYSFYAKAPPDTAQVEAHLILQALTRVLYTALPPNMGLAAARSSCEWLQCTTCSDTSDPISGKGQRGALKHVGRRRVKNLEAMTTSVAMGWTAEMVVALWRC